MLGRGDLLQAFDASAAALDGGATHARLKYLQVLALARLGETTRARSAYTAFGLAEGTDVDSIALGARIAKDEALRAPPKVRERLLCNAADAYDLVFKRTGATYPGINAASLALLAGDRPRATALAEAVLQHPDLDTGNSYYPAATAAEALLLLGRIDEAEAALRRATKYADANPGARSTTFRQLNLLEQALGPAIMHGRSLAQIVQPAHVVAYCGHMFRADAATERRIRQEVDRVLADNGTEIAFGSLACGADIVIAEAVLARGGQLNVVMPFLREDFVRQSVAPGGNAWIGRFEACLAAAAEVTVATETPYAADDAQYAYCAQLLMGQALLRAANLGTNAIQLAVSAGGKGNASAGTLADIAQWRTRGGQTIVIEPGDIDRNLDVAAPPTRTNVPKRAVRAMIFTDFAGFSKLSEAALPFFWENVMGRVAPVLEQHGDAVCSRNSWGDALFAVTATAKAAASIAVGLQAELAAVSHPEFSEGAGMRISAHLGPVYEAADPVTGRTTFYGCEVNRTARIEPVTPVGQIYVTGSFGAVLAMEAPDQYELSYVGRVKLAKAFGELPMYRLSSLSTVP